MAVMQFTPMNLAGVVRPSPASLACVKPHGLESFGLGLRQSVGFLRGVGGRVVVVRRRVRRAERRTGCVCMAGEKKDSAQPTTVPQGKEDDDDRRIDPLGFFKQKGLKTKAFQTFTRERSRIFFLMREALLSISCTT